MQTRTHREMTVPADTACLAQVRQAVIEVLGEVFSPVKANMIALAVDEAVANIVEHAYQVDGAEVPGGPDPRGGESGGGPGTVRANTIQVVLDANAQRFEVLIRDCGMGFDPREAPEVDVREHVKSGRKGGLGIFLMRRIMDEINYTFKHGVQNQLQMIKYIDPDAPGHKNKVAG